MALMLVRNYGFGARFRAHAQADLVPIKSVEHNFANGSESAYLHVYPIPDKVQAANAPLSCYEPGNDPILQLSAPNSSSLSSRRIIKHDRVDGFDYSLEPSTRGPASCTLRSGEALECGVGPALSVCNLYGAQEHDQSGGHLQISLTSRDVEDSGRAVSRLSETLMSYFTLYAQSVFLDRKGLQAGFCAWFRAWESGGLVAALTICMFYGGAHSMA
ncbi:MAG: hypothetical protein Q9204_004154 [Flavoplaca sp. TL-2023a]